MRYAAAPFELSQVRLTDGPIKRSQDLNLRYLLELDADRLLHNLRVNAGIPSSSPPLGGWEAPSCGLRGHFVGHYLSACARMYASTGEATLCEQVEHIVRELARCQAALGDGYLSAFPPSDLDTIETKFEGAWAPYYTLHKILAGLLDVQRYCGNATALDVAIRLANYICGRFERIPQEQLEPMLRTDKPNPSNEFGGMSEVLQDLYTITHDDRHLRLARKFDRKWFLDPLIRGEDQLTGLHANTHIPLALGAARRFELTGDARYRDAAIFFWERTAIARSYVNGGSSGPRPGGGEKSVGAEHWPHAHKLATTLTPKINESCVTHNMLRLTDTLFRWTADPRYAAFYERAYFNSVLCMQHPREVGRYIYDHPLSSRSNKTFGNADATFWCCYGTSVEAFARLASCIYYHTDDALWVNLPVASELSWKEKGLRVEQQTAFPHEGVTRLIFHCERPVELTVQVRGAVGATRRTWRDGDVLELNVPMDLHAQAMPDDPRMIAFMCGPLVLAAKTDQNLELATNDLASAVSLVRRSSERPYNFTVPLIDGVQVTLVPLNQIVDETFGAYFRLRPG